MAWRPGGPGHRSVAPQGRTGQFPLRAARSLSLTCLVTLVPSVARRRRRPSWLHGWWGPIPFAPGLGSSRGGAWMEPLVLARPRPVPGAHQWLTEGPRSSVPLLSGSLGGGSNFLTPLHLGRPARPPWLFPRATLGTCPRSAGGPLGGGDREVGQCCCQHGSCGDW